MCVSLLMRNVENMVMKVVEVEEKHTMNDLSKGQLTSL